MPRRFTANAMERIGHTVRAVERALHNPAGRRARWFANDVDVCEFRKFELKTELSTEGSGAGVATAYLRKEVSGSLETDMDTEFTVVDDIGDREGDGLDDVGSGEHGAYGKAMKWPGETTWYIFDLECPS